MVRRNEIWSLGKSGGQAAEAQMKTTIPTSLGFLGILSTLTTPGLIKTANQLQP